MKKNVLVVAFHFPPMGGSTGVLRSLKFAKYLPDYGWQPTVLTVHPRVYDRLDESGLRELPADTQIIRAFGLDAKKHLSIRSRYPQFLATPDRWISWSLGAIPAGLRAISKRNIDVIFSTYPIATAVLTGLALQRFSGKPWIADFRDPMTEDGYPADPWIRRAHEWIETRAVRRASRLVFTTESTRQDQERRHPEIGGDRSVVISNGYDEDDFAHLTTSAPRRPGAPVRLVHGGVIYPHDRDPRPFFRALRRMRDASLLAKGALLVELRGSGLDESFEAMVRDLGIADVVRFLPGIPYRESLSDAAAADGLMILQGQSCDRQIPAKSYEYLRLGRPIFGLTSPTGETAALLRRAGGATVADLTDEDEITAKLTQFIGDVRDGAHPLPDRDHVSEYSRSSQAGLLAANLDSLTRHS